MTSATCFNVSSGPYFSNRNLYVAEIVSLTFCAPQCVEPWSMLIGKRARKMDERWPVSGTFRGVFAPRTLVLAQSSGEMGRVLSCPAWCDNSNTDWTASVRRALVLAGDTEEVDKVRVSVDRVAFRTAVLLGMPIRAFYRWKRTAGRCNKSLLR